MDWRRTSIDTTFWRWETFLSYPWKDPGQHITILELQAFLDALRFTVRSSFSHNQRRFAVLDNQCAVSVLAKGRSSVKRLNVLLRRVTAVSLASRTRWFYGWVRSKDNPADGPSRWRKKDDA
jgi:hypothetical protein